MVPEDGARHTGSDSMPSNQASDMTWVIVSLWDGSLTRRDRISLMAVAEMVGRSGVLNEQSMILRK